MKIICAWCGKELEDDPQDERTDHEISHGICRPCLSNFLEEERPTMTEYMNQLDVPILLVNDNVEILFATDSALQILGKELHAVMDFRGGQAIECSYARLPGGCGNTIHCRECAIRNTVTETYHTGKPSIKTPAYYDQHTPNGIKRVNLLISTMKADNTVILRINEIG